MTIRFGLALAVLSLATSACGGDSDVSTTGPLKPGPTQIRSGPAYLNQEVAAGRTRRGSNQRRVLLFANAWLKDFSEGSDLVCTLMTRETDCRRFQGKMTPLQRSFIGARPTRISKVTPEDKAAVRFSNGRSVTFLEIAELWKAFDLNSDRAGKYFR